MNRAEPSPGATYWWADGKRLQSDPEQLLGWEADPGRPRRRPRPTPPPGPSPTTSDAGNLRRARHGRAKDGDVEVLW
jgi:hypothetical protein